jgi:hypothetical protein
MEDIVDRCMEGETPDQVAWILGKGHGWPVETAFVRWVRRCHFLDTETGEPEPDARIVAMVRLRNDGETIRAIAAKAGISKSAADRVLKGERRLSYYARCEGLEVRR